jgi:uncharacterized protein with LGFP repeats
VRRSTPVAFLSLAVPALLALPVATPPSAQPHPVPGRTQSLQVHGIAPGLATAQAAGAAGRALAALTERRSTDEFDTVGVTWEQGSAPNDMQVEVRVRSDGRWSSWTELEPMDAGPDAGTPEGRAARGGTEPLSVDESDGVQVRVSSPSGRGARDMRVDLVDPGESAADADVGGRPQPYDVASAETSMPDIITRQEWGADETLRRGSPDYSSTVKVAYVHHTASTNDYTEAEAAAQVRSFYRYHTQSLGWSDLGYNFLVDRFGRIYEGRYGGMDRAVIGAHAGGFNTSTLGVAMVGTYSTVSPSSATLESVQRVIAWRLSQYGRDPQGTATLTSAGGSTSRYPKGTEVKVDVISGHRDTNSTSCPGDLGYSKLPSIRTAVSKIIATETASAIDNKHKALGGDTGLLGPAVSPVTELTTGAYRVYRNGRIYWSPRTGAREVHGAILDRYVRFGGSSSVLGFPTTDETRVSGGRASGFEGGAISWTPTTGAFVVHGAIGERWGALGRESGPMRAPLTDELPSSDGLGRYNHFQGGTIMWSPRTGAWAVQGAIRHTWGLVGAERGVLGYPLTNESVTIDGVGRFNHFQRGSIFWTPHTGAHEVHGAIRDLWTSMGWERGPLGYPLTSESVTFDQIGRYSHFQHGSVFWHPLIGAHEVRGAIRHRWASMGWERGRLGYPTSNEYSVPGGRRSDFQFGSIVWDAATGATKVV